MEVGLISLALAAAVPLHVLGKGDQGIALHPLGTAEAG